MRRQSELPTALRPIFCSDAARRPEPTKLRLNDLRHRFASRALALGEGLPMIGDLLGHRKVSTTARYAHLVRDSSARVAADIGARIMQPDGR